jgi:Ras GTPase-activating-like protein IQGAP2/3
LTEDYEFELKPLAVYHALAKQQGKTNTDISVEELSSNNEVQDILRQRVAQLTKVCDDILKIAIDNVNSVPYGLRLICKQIMSSAQARFPKAAQQDILKVIGYYVFYRFMNLIIVTPEAFDIEAPPAGKRKNLITVSIVLQRLFNLDLFPSKNVMTPLNDWITKNIPNVEDYFKTLMDVTDPEEYLQVNKYMDLYSTEKPFVIISLEEITEIHSLLYRHLGQLAPEPNDPLRIIMADLGDVPTMTESQKETEVQLTLENRFKDVTKNILDDDSNINVKYEQTVDYVVKILGAIVKMGKRQHTLMEVLQAAREYASGSNDKILQSLVTKTEENLKILAEHNKVDPEKNYSEFLRDVAFKVVNRTNRREQQLKELERLRLAYKNIMKYQGYLNNQLMEYQKYLISCRQNVYRNSKHRKKMVQKFHFKDLVKRGVIEMGESEMNASEKKINLFIKMLDPIENGTFDIEAKLAGLVVAKLKLELDDLLDKKETGVTSYEMDNFTLNVPETLFLLNKYFLS